MVLDLSDNIQKMKAVISVGRMFGAVFILFGVIWLFSEIFQFMEILITSILFGTGIVWLAIAGSYGKKLEKTQSKMFDLTGGRAAFEY